MTNPSKPYTLHHGDTLAVLRGMADNSIDSIVTDPPYGLKFMGRKWDADVPESAVWAEALRVLKPGGHLLCFAGTRTHHRMATRIEEGGFELRDMIAWVYGSGFPKSLDVGKAIDKAAGAERAVVGLAVRVDGRVPELEPGNCAHTGYSGGFDAARKVTAPATEAAKTWQGWGTALKPALEPITLARKPFAGTVASNVLAHGTGGINVDGCRVQIDEQLPNYTTPGSRSDGAVYSGGWTKGPSGNPTADSVRHNAMGRWPANLIHDGSAEVVAGFPDTGPSPVGPVKQGGQKSSGGIMNANGGDREGFGVGYGDTGSAARFFYCAKASASERDAGLQDFELRKVETMNSYAQPSQGRTADKNGGPRRNTHETVKPLKLMRYLVRLVTPPGGTVLDAYCGSGTTGAACMHEGFKFVGIDSDPRSIALSQARIAHAYTQATQATAAAAPKT